jgi:hypothetical protein
MVIAIVAAELELSLARIGVLKQRQMQARKASGFIYWSPSRCCDTAADSAFGAPLRRAIGMLPLRGVCLLLGSDLAPKRMISEADSKVIGMGV